MMNKEQKKTYINEMTAQFENSEAVLVTHYQGLTVKQLDELKKTNERTWTFNLKLQKIELLNLALEKF